MPINKPEDAKTSHDDQPPKELSGVLTTIPPGQEQLPPAIPPPQPPKPTGMHNPGINLYPEKQCGETIGLNDTPEHTKSTFTPNFTEFNRLVAHLDELLSTNFYYGRNVANHLAGDQVKIYYNILAFIAIFKQMISAGKADQEIADFVEYMESSFNIKDLPIDGTMTQFFAALATSKPEDTIYLDVLPTVPVRLASIYNDELKVFNSEYISLLPNMPILFRSVRRQLTGVHGANNVIVPAEGQYNLTTEETQLNGQALPGQAAGAGPPVTEYLRIMPGLATPCLKPGDHRIFQRTYRNWPPTPTIAGRNTWAKFLGFTPNQDHEWFNTLCSFMIKRTGYINGSTTFDNAFTYNTGICKTTIDYSDSYEWNSTIKALCTELAESHLQSLNDDEDAFELDNVRTAKTRKRAATVSKPSASSHKDHLDTGFTFTRHHDDATITLDHESIVLLVATATKEFRKEYLSLHSAKNFKKQVQTREMTATELQCKFQLTTSWNCPGIATYYHECHPDISNHRTGPFWNIPIRLTSANITIGNNTKTTLTNHFIRNRSEADRM